MNYTSQKLYLLSRYAGLGQLSAAAEGQLTWHLAAALLPSNSP